MNLQELRDQKQADYDRLKPIEERLNAVLNEKEAAMVAARLEWYNALQPLQALKEEIKALDRLIKEVAQ